MVRTEFPRFLLVGGFNTVMSYIIYRILLLILPYMLAYTIAYACGIVISYFLNAMFVFRTQPNFKDFVKFPAIYIFQYFFGAVLLQVVVSFGLTSKEAGMLLVIFLSIPITFLLTRILLIGRVAE